MGLSPEQVKTRNDALIYNLRWRWKTELAHFGDKELVRIYDDFFISEYAGKNDEHFLQFIKDCWG